MIVSLGGRVAEEGERRLQAEEDAKEAVESAAASVSAAEARIEGVAQRCEELTAEMKVKVIQAEERASIFAERFRTAREDVKQRTERLERLEASTTARAAWEEETSEQLRQQADRVAAAEKSVVDRIAADKEAALKEYVVAVERRAFCFIFSSAASLPTPTPTHLNPPHSIPLPPYPTPFQPRVAQGNAPGTARRPRRQDARAGDATDWKHRGSAPARV